RFAGNDNGVRINDNVSRAAVMTTTNQGSYSAATFKLEYPNKKGVYGMIAHTVSNATELMSAGSIASGSWTGVRSVRGGNDLDLSFADQNDPGRTVGLLGYRFEYGGDFGGATGFTLGRVDTAVEAAVLTYITQCETCSTTASMAVSTLPVSVISFLAI
ncbi:MAG: hypothetical protein ACKOCH_06890, partial [Bacteroidota bacterium]